MSISIYKVMIIPWRKSKQRSRIEGKVFSFICMVIKGPGEGTLSRI